MEAFQTVAIVLFGGTAGWAYLKLKERIEFLEHEVRWLRDELEALKPTEIKSEYDQTSLHHDGTTKYDACVEAEADTWTCMRDVRFTPESRHAA